MTADWPDDNPSAHRAAAIYTQRVPLAHDATGLGTGTNSVIGGGHTNLISGVNVDQPSFHMLIGLNAGVPGTTVPFGRLKFQWTDIASGFTVDPDWAVLTGAVSGLNFTYVFGPVRADQLTIELDNLEPTNLLSYSFGISAVSHTYDEFKIQEVGGSSAFGFTRPAQQNQMGVLGSVNASIPASGTVDRLCMAAGGKAILSSNNDGGVSTVRVQLLDPGIIAGGAPILGLSNSGILATQEVQPALPTLGEVSLPNGPVVIRQINTSTTTAQQPTTVLMRSRQ